MQLHNTSHSPERSQHTLLALPGEPRKQEWEDRAVSLFEQRMLDVSRPFPCVFGVDAVRRATLRYCFVSRVDGTSALRQGLREFAEQCHDLGKRTSLVMFFEPDPTLRSTKDYRRRFWELLGGLIDTDDQQWPPDIDTNTESPSWEFSCFGIPFFVVANTPCHEYRQSRYFEYFAITFQPRFVFDDLSADTVTGKNARKIIRKRLQEYDHLAPYPALGSFGSTTNREWVQYFLPDDNQVPSTAQKCPLHYAIQNGKSMTTPEFSYLAPAEVSTELLELLPEQGSVELQNDQPGKVFAWHKHDRHEELFVLSGDVTLFWVDAEGSYHEQECGQGSYIKLPAGTVHGSTAGGEGAHYVIKPEGGQTAVTTFLPQAEWPYPPASPVA